MGQALLWVQGMRVDSAANKIRRRGSSPALGTHCLVETEVSH